ncbi:hypothetical protein ACQ86N_02655 [Puia sp. P3]|uniref:hypothetical protein n=1 Tax=Puia sp. P3 TaxID=3423952 RepID=UPI003D6764EE
MGKVFVIYPAVDSDLATLAKQLVQITREIRCPKVSTDYYLGGGVFTRYVGGPAAGKAAINDYAIPFQLEQGITWPFGELVTYQPKTNQKIMRGRYVPAERLKGDFKGNVYKGIWLKRLVFLQVVHHQRRQGKYVDG